MTTKLTLTLQQSTIEAAKIFAEKNGRSLSAIVESYLKMLSSSAKTEHKFSPQVERLIGSAKLPQDYDYKTDIAESLIKKHCS